MNDAHREYLKLVAGIFWNPHEVRDIVVESGIAPEDVNWDQTATEQWRDILRLALRTEWLQRLHDVITSRLGTAADRSRLDALILLMLPSPPGRSSWYSVDRPWLARLVGQYAQRAVFDRSGLRSFCQSMISGRPVFFIVGEPQSGKSHSWFLIHHVAMATGYVPLLIDIAEAPQTSRYTATSLMRDIVDQLGISLGILGDAAQPSPPRCLVNRLIGRLPDDGRRRWLVIDGVDRPNVTGSTINLVEALARAVERSELRDMQLTVTGYDGPLAHYLPGAGLEKIRPIGRPEVEHFFRDTADHLKVSLAPEFLGALMDKLYDGLGERPDLGVISRRAAEMARSVLGGSAA